MLELFLFVVFVFFCVLVYKTMTTKAPKPPVLDPDKSDPFRRTSAIAELKENLARAKVAYRDQIAEMVDDDPRNVSRSVGRMMKRE